VDDAAIQEENASGNFPDDLAEGRNDTTDDDEEYVDPFTADYTDFPEGYNFDETRISANEERELVV